MISWTVYRNNLAMYWTEKDDRKQRLIYSSGIFESWRKARQAIRDLFREKCVELDFKKEDEFSVTFNDGKVEETVEIKFDLSTKDIMFVTTVKVTDTLTLTINHEYRPNVIIGLIQDKKILFGERIKIPNSWQMPQGGIDPGETVERAAFRELAEELGLLDPQNQARYLGQLSTNGPLIYDFPTTMLENEERGDKYKGQHQFVALFEFLGKDADISLSRCDEEFSRYEWIPIRELYDLINSRKLEIPFFKLEVYLEVAHELMKFDLTRKIEEEDDSLVTNLTDLKDNKII